MANARTLATLVASDNTTGQVEIVQIFIPFLPTQTEQIHQYIDAFCLDKNLGIVFLPDVTGWPERILRQNNRLPPGEFDCQVCGQACLQNGIDINDPLQIQERFCSNFCLVSHEESK